MENDEWLKLFKIKQYANIAIEEKREKKLDRSEIKLFLKKDELDILDKLNLDDFIVSKAERNYQ